MILCDEESQLLPKAAEAGHGSSAHTTADASLIAEPPPPPYSSDGHDCSHDCAHERASTRFFHALLTAFVIWSVLGCVLKALTSFAYHQNPSVSARPRQEDSIPC
jgi:hypothetical protein